MWYEAYMKMIQNSFRPTALSWFSKNKGITAQWYIVMGRVLCKIEIFELSFWHPQASFNSQKLDVNIMLTNKMLISQFTLILIRNALYRY